MKNRAAWMLIGIFLSLSIVAKAQDKQMPFVNFKIKNAGLMVDGYFSDYQAKIEFDENDVSKSRFYGEVKTKSISTGISLRDNHLVKKEYFDANTFPLMKFSSTVVTKISENKLKIIGDLTIKGVTKKIVIDVDYSKFQQSYVFKSSFKLNRRDFNVGSGSWTLSDDLVVFIQAIKLNEK